MTPFLICILVGWTSLKTIPFSWMCDIPQQSYLNMERIWAKSNGLLQKDFQEEMWSGASLANCKNPLGPWLSKYLSYLVMFNRFGWFKVHNSSAMTPAKFCLSSQSVERSIRVISSISGTSCAYLLWSGGGWPSSLFLRSDIIPSLGSLYRLSNPLEYRSKK